MFFTVKSWNFAGLFCRLIAGKGFENRSSAMAGTTTTTSPSTYLTEKKRGDVVCVGLVGQGGLVYGAFWSHNLVPWSGSLPQQSMQPGTGYVQVSRWLPGSVDPI